MPDRRANPRLYVPVEATWESVSRRAEVRIVGMSLTGCFIESRPTPTPGELLALTIRFPDATPLAVKAWVVHVNTVLEGFAVRFVEVAEDVQSQLGLQLMAHGLKNPWDSADPG